MQYWSRVDIPQPPDTWKQQKSRLCGAMHTADTVQKQAHVTKPTVFCLFVCLYTGAKQDNNGISKYEKLNLDIGIVVSVLQNNCKEATNLGIRWGTIREQLGNLLFADDIFLAEMPKLRSMKERTQLHSLPKNSTLGKITVERRRCSQKVYWSKDLLKTHKELSSPWVGSHPPVTSVPGDWHRLLASAGTRCACGIYTYLK